MAKPRIDFHNELVSLLESRYVYFQPPDNLKIKYPCIRYVRSGSNNKQADNINYLNKKRYTVTLIDENPDSVFSDRLENLEYSSFDRFYTVDNLNHWVYTIYR